MFHGASEGSCESIQHLLQHGANPSILNDMQESPLDAAMQRHFEDIVNLFNQMAQHPAANGTMNHMHDPYRKKPKKTKAASKMDPMNGHDMINGQHQKQRKKRKKRAEVAEDALNTLSPPNSLDSPQSVNHTPPPLYATQRMVGPNFEQGMFVANAHMIPLEYSDRHAMGPGIQHSPCREALECESPEGHMNIGQMGCYGSSRPQHMGPGERRVLYTDSAMPQMMQQASNTQPLVLSPSRSDCEYRTHRSPNRGQAPQPPSYQQSPASMQPSTPHCEVPRAQANSPVGGGEMQQIQNNHMYVGSPGQTQLLHYPTPPSNHSMGAPMSTGNSPMQQQTQQGYPEILTPSPEAVDRWSSSPHKSPIAADWSVPDGISSSPARGECPAVDMANLPTNHYHHQYTQKTAYL